MFGCKEYVQTDINGGWNIIIDGQYCELWFESDLVLDWNYDLGTIRIRNYEVKDNIIHFSDQHFQDETPQGIAFSFKIKKLDNETMILEDINHPEHLKFNYSFINEKAPEFSIEILNTGEQLVLERRLKRNSEERINHLND